MTQQLWVACLGLLETVNHKFDRADLFHFVLFLFLYNFKNCSLKEDIGFCPIKKALRKSEALLIM